MSAATAPVSAIQIDASHRSAGAREIALVAIGLAALIAMQLWVCDAYRLFGRHLWLDEVHTYLLVADPDVGHSMRALAGGTDNSPPTLYLMLRYFCAPLGGPGPVSFRIFDLTFMWIALVGMYTCLRQEFGRWASLAGTLLMWAHPLIVIHAFDTRYYAPLLAATSWFYFLLKKLGNTKHWLPVAIGVAICAMFTCTLHYFGIITLALVTLGHFRLDPRGRKQSWRDLIPVAAGPVALVAFAVYFLPKQRAALSATWVPPLNAVQIQDFFENLFPVKLLLVTLGAGVIAIALRRVPGCDDSSKPSARTLRHFAGLLALLLVPVVMVLFSELVQPSLISRYAITTVLALPVLAAFLLAQGRAIMPAVTCVAIVVLGSISLSRHAERWAGAGGYDGNLDRLVAAIREHTGDAPVIFEYRQHLYPVTQVAPDLAPRCGYWDFDKPRPAYRLCERDVARAIHKFYRPPVLWHETQLPGMPKAYLVTFTQDSTVQLVQQELPGFTARKLAKDLYEIVRLP